MKKITKSNAPILYALCDMWMQYCPPRLGHMFMGAGENAEEVLEDYGLLKRDGSIDYSKVEKYL